MLPGLRHRTIRGIHDKYRTIHLSSPRNHILNVICMTRAVNMSIVTRLSLIFNVGCIYGYTSSFFLWGSINILILLSRTSKLR